MDFKRNNPSYKFWNWFNELGEVSRMLIVILVFFVPYFIFILTHNIWLLVEILVAISTKTHFKWFKTTEDFDDENQKREN